MTEKKSLRIAAVVSGVALVASVIAFRSEIRRSLAPVENTLRGRYTVADRLRQYGAAAHARLVPQFRAAGVEYPPAGVTLIGFKQERILEVWARSSHDSSPAFVTEYRVVGASGDLGPKLREGDRQVPEGLYRIESLNPNSRFHLSLRLNYPNALDRRHARRDGRTDPGSDIMIHGGSQSVGCLAMGDQVAEDLFVLAADTGTDNVRVILSPVDFRERTLPHLDRSLPEWTGASYRRIKERLRRFRHGK